MPKLFSRYGLEGGCYMKSFYEYQKTGSIDIRNSIIENNLDLVKKIAFQIKNKYILKHDINDLIAYGVFGLIDSIDKFKPEMGYRFSTYASKRIYGSIIDELRKTDWVPRNKRMIMKLVREEMSLVDDNSPSTEFSIAKKFGLNLIDFNVMNGDQFISLTALENTI